MILLLEFRVSNFLSFEDEQVFSMEASKIRSKIDHVYRNHGTKLLKFKAIYGANASGKSNLIQAFDFAQAAIVAGVSRENTDCYCRLAEENQNIPSHFEFTILVDGEKYIYGFETLITSGDFCKEYLKKTCRGGDCRIIFSRDTTSGEYEVDTFFRDASLNERLRIYADDVRVDSSILFLRLMNQNKDALYSNESEINLYKRIYDWFKYKLSVNYPDSPITNYSYLTDTGSVEQIGKLLSAFGTGISEFMIADIPVEKVTAKLPKGLMQRIIDDLNEQKRVLEQNGRTAMPAIMLRSAEDNSMFIIQLSEDEIQCKTLRFRHRGTLATFSATEESDGTMRLLDLIEVLLNKERGKVYIVDEINRRFHPLLTCKFVEEYLSRSVNHDIQFIVTTHESRLMDLNILRQDEIGFVNKNKDGRSTIASLDASNARFDKKICKAYLDGDYGSIPEFQFGEDQLKP